MGVSVETARRAVRGIGTPDPETVAALVEQLGADVEDWTGQRVTAGPYVPPSESALLTGPQRDALTDLIRAIAAGQRQRAGGEHDQRSAPMNQAGTAPASNVHDLNRPQQDEIVDVGDMAARPGEVDGDGYP